MLLEKFVAHRQLFFLNEIIYENVNVAYLSYLMRLLDNVTPPFPAAKAPQNGLSAA